ncbi:hypothetical protein [Arthrobacter sp. EPSL27]|uniref:hypothetical protein n=1 Tax=Arthrobacter sp. EPSL27 TaxID=1745378 RepID=UPI00074924FD|nr:hypothetical protein [Arthrobacter sp. EPSL27]KUM32498.1 hypothetical protein AR539_18325 [Arthrobacter sp. EPSL27]
MTDRRDLLEEFSLALAGCGVLTGGDAGTIRFLHQPVLFGFLAAARSTAELADRKLKSIWLPVVKRTDLTLAVSRFSRASFEGNQLPTRPAA